MNLLNHFQNIVLSNDQQNALEKLYRFVQSDERIFILKGYAGSGKTTLLKGLVNFLQSKNKNHQLMAPTGRAAKVLHEKTGYEATTIHKGIYSLNELHEIEEKDEEGPSFQYHFKIRNNPDVHNTILIVDEASMISDFHNEGEFFRFGSGFLLHDLITYSRLQDSTATSKIIFVGDPAQLPPVEMNFSPALDPEYLNSAYNLFAKQAEMKQVIRQESDNHILVAATKIRQSLTSGFFTDFDLRPKGRDLLNITYEDFVKSYNETQEPKIIICYKNETARELNRTIRTDRFNQDLPIQPGDKIIIGRNNYGLDIKNGEFGVVAEASFDIIQREISFKLKGGKTQSVVLRWRKISLLLPSENAGPRTVVGYSLENYLHGDNLLKAEEQRALYIDFKIRHPRLKSGTEEFKEAIKNDPFFNCIQLKYGYAVTCHKAQGGEWSDAFVFWDRGASSNGSFYESNQDASGKANSDFYRWAYTAVTRASKRLHCINPPYFTSFSSMTFVDSNVRQAYVDLTGQSPESIEIDLDESIVQQLQKQNLADAPISIQDHFIHRWYHLSLQGISIQSWKRAGYEIWYIFEKNGKTAGLKYWMNKFNEIGPKYMEIPSQTNSEELLEEVTGILEKSKKVDIYRTTAEGILNKVQFDFEIEENKPFLMNLFEGITSKLEKGESVEEVSHLEYRDRYTFKKGGASCVMDFEYKKNGLFGRVLPLEKKCNSKELKLRIKDIVNQLKDPNHVF